jgi:hypothetical protein
VYAPLLLMAGLTRLSDQKQRCLRQQSISKSSCISVLRSASAKQKYKNKKSTATNGHIRALQKPN